MIKITWLLMIYIDFDFYLLITPECNHTWNFTDIAFERWRIQIMKNWVLRNLTNISHQKILQPGFKENKYCKDLQISRTFFPKICDQNRRCGLSARPFRTASGVQSSIVRYYAWLHSFAECMQENNKFTCKILWKTASNGEIPVKKYQNNINHMS